MKMLRFLLYFCFLRFVGQPLPPHTLDMYPIYKPLDRSKNEIRLLRILPPEELELSDSFELNTEIIRCELLHSNVAIQFGIKAAQASQVVDYLLGPDIEGGRRQVAHAKLMGMIIPEREEQEWISPERRTRMESLLDAWYERLQHYLPPGSVEARPDFDLWSKRWIWKPLSGNPFPDTHRDGYFALSYVWGDQKIKKNIEVDGKTVEVGENLYQALRTLREIPEIRMGTPVWVDALCINQQDFEERTVEVKRMADIYSKAIRVISYLGDEKNFSDDGVDFLHFLSLKDDEFLRRLGELWLENPHLVSGEPGAAISRFLARPYWTRVWILQEIFLSRPGSVMIYGARKIHTRNLLESMKVFQLLGMASKEEIWLRGKSYTDPEVRSLEAGIWRVFRTKTLVVRSLDVADNGKPVLLDGDLLNIMKTLHQNAGSAECYDERDKVYGQLAMLDHRISDFVNVSYAEEHSFMHTMVDLAIAVVKGAKRLDWIHCTWAVVLEEDEWPSWVPDFRIGKDGHHYRWSSQPGDASTTDAKGVEFEMNGMSLKCKGYRFDVIVSATESLADMSISTQDKNVDEDFVKLADAYTNSEDHPGMPDRISYPAIRRKKTHHVSQVKRYSYLNSHASHTHKYATIEGLHNAFSACMERIGWSAAGINVMDIPWELNDEIDFSGTSIYDGARSKIFMKVFRELNENFKFFGQSFKQFFPTRGKDYDISQFRKFMENMQWFDKVLPEGRLVVTQKGYMGAAINDILPGDEIVVLEGCKLPIVLRRFGEKWRLVGSVYIHGIMDGEAMVYFREEKRSAETFPIY